MLNLYFSTFHKQIHENLNLAHLGTTVPLDIRLIVFANKRSLHSHVFNVIRFKVIRDCDQRFISDSPFATLH